MKMEMEMDCGFWFDSLGEAKRGLQCWSPKRLFSPSFLGRLSTENHTDPSTPDPTPLIPSFSHVLPPP